MNRQTAITTQATIITSAIEVLWRGKNQPPPTASEVTAFIARHQKRADPMLVEAICQKLPRAMSAYRSLGGAGVIELYQELLPDVLTRITASIDRIYQNEKETAERYWGIASTKPHKPKKPIRESFEQRLTARMNDLALQFRFGVRIEKRHKNFITYVRKALQGSGTATYQRAFSNPTIREHAKEMLNERQQAIARAKEKKRKLYQRTVRNQNPIQNSPPDLRSLRTEYRIRSPKLFSPRARIRPMRRR